MPLMRLLSVLLLVAAALPALDRQAVEFARPGGKPLLLDLHVPDGAGPFPAAIVVHGGGFDEGTRTSFVTPLFQPLADAGFAWFTIDYRLAPEFRFPQAREDVDAAIKWLKAHAAEYRVDPARIALIGESAGAFLVAYAGTHYTPETRVRAVVDFYGPVDYEALSLDRRDHPERFNIESVRRHFSRGGGMRFFGAEQLDPAGLAKLRDVAPLRAVHKGMPPLLVIHGTKDDQVPYSQSTVFCDAIRKAGADCRLIPIEGGGHGMSGWKDPSMQHWRAAMIDWLRNTLR
jgi:alpha-L-fucosidase 2